MVVKWWLNNLWSTIVLVRWAKVIKHQVWAPFSHHYCFWLKPAPGYFTTYLVVISDLIFWFNLPCFWVIDVHVISGRPLKSLVCSTSASWIASYPFITTTSVPAILMVNISPYWARKSANVSNSGLPRIFNALPATKNMKRHYIPKFNLRKWILCILRFDLNNFVWRKTMMPDKKSETRKRK